MVLLATLNAKITYAMKRIWDKLIDEPVAGDDGQFLRYNHGAGTFSWETAIGSYGRGVTKVVVASDSLDTTNADYICNGTNDEVEIQSALNAVSTAGGGTVLLMEGNYNISAPIVAKVYVTLKGLGWYGSRLKSIGNSNIIDHGTGSSNYYFSLMNLFFNANSGTGIGITWDDNSKDMIDSHITDCWFAGYSTTFGAIKLGNDAAFRTRIHLCKFTTCKRAISDASNQHTEIIDCTVNFKSTVASAWSLIAGGTHSRIINNTIWAAGNTATCAIDTGAGGQCDGNRIEGGYGAILVGARGQAVGNYCYDQTVRGIRSEGGQVVGNYIRGGYTCDYGIDIVANGTYIQQIVGNHVSECTSYGIQLPATDKGGECSGNTCQNNTTADIYIPDGCPFNVHGNYVEDHYHEQKLMKYKNTSGGLINAGEVVILKSVAAGNEITTTTTRGDDKVLGVAVANISDTEWGYVQKLGKITSLKVDGTENIAVGDYIGTFTTAGIGCKARGGESVIAIALEAYATDDSNGVIDALIIQPNMNSALVDQYLKLDCSNAPLTGNLSLSDTKHININDFFIGASAGDAGNLATNVYWDGAQWVGAGDAGVMFQLNPAEAFYWYKHDGATPANFTNLMQLDVGGNLLISQGDVGLNVGDFNLAAGNVNLTNGGLAAVRANGASQILFSSVADEGGYLTSTAASQFMISGGAVYNGSDWVAKATEANIIASYEGVMYFYADTSLTIDNTFTPTEIMRVAPAGVYVGSATNHLLMSNAGVVTLIGTAKRTLTIRPDINAITQIAQAKPTESTEGVFKGFSFPIYNNDHEELFISTNVPGRWDEASDIIVHISCALSKGEDVGDYFKFQLQWNNVADEDDIVPAITHDVTAEQIVLAGRSVAYNVYQLAFTIDWDADGAGNEVAAHDLLAMRLRRIDATNPDVDEEIIVFDWHVAYTVDKMFKA